MYVLVTYDVETASPQGTCRLRRVAKICVKYGQRVQNSVFECVADAAEMVRIKNKLVELIDPEKDSLRFYYLGNKYQTKIEHVGAKPTYEAEGFLAL